MASTASVTVEVKTKADLAAINSMKAAWKDLQDTIDAGGLVTNAQLNAAGAFIDKNGKLTRTWADETEKAGKAAKKVNDEFSFFKVNMSKAVGETQVLVRELVTGSFHARTLGSLLSALGPGITAGAIAIIAVVELIKSARDAAIELREEIIKGTEALDKQIESWERMSEAVRTEHEMATLTHAAADAIRDLDQKVGELTRKSEDVSKFRREFIALIKATEGPDADKFKGTIFGDPAVDAKKADAEAKRVRANEAAIGAITRAQNQQDRAISRTPEETANIERLNDVLADQQKRYEALDPASKTFIEDQKELGAQIGITTDQLQKIDVITLEQKLASLKDAQLALDPTSKDFVKNFDKIQNQIQVVNKDLEAAVQVQQTYQNQLLATRGEVDQMVKSGQSHMEVVLKQQQAEEDLARGAMLSNEERQKTVDLILELETKQGELNRNIASEELAWQQLESRLKNLRTAYDQTSIMINAVTVDLEKLNAEVNRQVTKGNTGLQSALDLHREIAAEAAVNNAKGNEELTISNQVDQKKEQIRQKYEAINKAAGAQVVSEAEITKEMDIGGEALRHRLEVVAGTGTAQSTLNTEMKEYETILQDIRQQQTVLKDQAFIGVDAQNVQMLRLYRQEIVTVINAMQQQQQRKATLTDPAEIARANQELQKFSAQYQVLAAKIVTTTHQFQAGLQSWANSFGSTGQQLATTLQQTVGVALQSFNQWVVTGKFNMQQLLQSVVQLGLQLVEQLIIQRAVALINSSLAETQAVASAQIIAAAWAGAATAVTTATEGQAAYSAPAAMAIGLAGVKGVLGIGSLHEGGGVSDRRMHSGGLAHDEVPIIAQQGEIMIRRDVAQAPGMADFLLGLNAGEFHTGGFISGRRYHDGSDDRDIIHFPFPGPPLPPHWATQGGGFNYSDVYNPHEFGGFTNMVLNNLMGAGFIGPIGTPGFLQGPTMIPTTFNSMGYPHAVPLGPSDATINPGYLHHSGLQMKPKHTGGIIDRFHNGGSVGGGRSGGGGVHIYAFTDLKQLTRHMASKDGQKIIFDTVKGRRIDLGM